METKRNIIPYASISIDLNTKEYLKLLFEFAKTHSRPKLQNMLETTFLKNPEKERLIVNLSVRTAFDLYLQAANFPIGSEIIMTCINIPDMATVARHHGLVVVPVNVDFDNLAPKLEEIEASITEKTRAIMVSYVYGVNYDIDQIIQLAKKHNLTLLEDLAETFSGTDYNGHPEADLSLFSFGTIKINTALNGALTVVRNNDVLYRKMKYIHDLYPMQLTSTYLKKVIKVAFALAAINNPSAIQYAERDFGVSAKEWAVSLVRGFPADGDFLSKFRFQPCNTLLANLALRMQSFDNVYLAKRMKVLKRAQDRLVAGGVKVPGHAKQDRSFWLFPIVVPDIPLCYKALCNIGVDAYLGATQLRVIQPPSGSHYANVDETQAFFDNVLYLPFHKEVPDHVVDELVDRTIQAIQDVTKQLAQRPKL